VSEIGHSSAPSAKHSVVRALAALELLGPSDPVAELSIESRRLFASLALSRVEHHRRQEIGAGAVTSTGLLHALWELPAGVPIPWNVLSGRDADTLRFHGSRWVQDDGACVVRRYEPAGKLRVVAIHDERLGRALERVARVPPVYERVAVWTRSGRRRGAPEAHLAMAAMLGIGIVAVEDDKPSVLVHPAPAQPGMPSVYRWWMAELAYRNWLIQREPTARADAWA